MINFPYTGSLDTLIELRLKAGLSRAKLAEMMLLSEQTIQDWEDNASPSIDPEEVSEYASLCGFSPVAIEYSRSGMKVEVLPALDVEGILRS